MVVTRSFIFGVVSAWLAVFTAACGNVPGSNNSTVLSDAGGAPDAAGDDGPVKGGVTSGTLVLFGGYDVTPQDETWTFDGVKWTKVATPQTPLPRAGAAMATLGNRVVLFGGTNTDIATGYMKPLDDTWIFDGKTWAEIKTASRPPARALATMGTLDGKVVLFGGVTGTGETALNDTWTFDGTNWTQVPTSTSPPVYSANGATNMTLDGDRLVLVSGSTGLSANTWAFGSTNWTLLSVEAVPANMTNGAGLAPLNGDLILYSGGANETEAVATWQLDGEIWNKIPIDADAAASDIPEPYFVRPMVSVGDHILLVAPRIYGYGDEPMEVWKFDGAKWSNLHVLYGPPRRTYLAWTYVPEHDSPNN